MGGRVSRPRGPAGTTEASRLPSPSDSNQGYDPRARRRRLRYTYRQIAVPAGAIVMACIFYVYSRTAVQAAKVNAERHRDADGGSINWRNESLRRHGALKKPEERTLWQQLTSKKESEEEAEERRSAGKRELEERRRKGDVNPIEEAIRTARQRRDSE